MKGWSSGGPEAIRRGRVVRSLLARIGLEIDGAVLDVGCGEGGVLRGFADGVHTAIGIDVDLRPLSRSGKVLGPTERSFVAAGDATRLPFADGTFRVVLMYDVVEHVRDWRVALMEASRVLRPGGGVVITAANPWSPITILDDPHWHRPFLSVLPVAVASRLTNRLGPLEMGGDHPSFPRWGDLQRALREAGLCSTLVTNLEKIRDPEAVVHPGRRRISHALRSRRIDRRLERPPLLWLIRTYDRFLARSWTFIATKRS